MNKHTQGQGMMLWLVFLFVWLVWEHRETHTHTPTPLCLSGRDRLTGSRERGVCRPGWLVWENTHKHTPTAISTVRGTGKDSLAVWSVWEHEQTHPGARNDALAWFLVCLACLGTQGDIHTPTPLCLSARARLTGSRERWVGKPGWLVWINTHTPNSSVYDLRREGLASLDGWFQQGDRVKKGSSGFVVGLGRQRQTQEISTVSLCKAHRFKGERDWQVWVVGLDKHTHTKLHCV